jgi:hypothetical protein
MTEFVVAGVQTLQMEHHRLRKYRGPKTWARVRAAYVAGEPAPSVARRFNVGLASLRRRALKEGWTRSRCGGGADDSLPGIGALNLDDDPEARMAPRDALERAAGRAVWLLAHDRAAEALASLAQVGVPDRELEASFDRMMVAAAGLSRR